MRIEFIKEVGIRRRGRPRADGLDSILPGPSFVRERIRELRHLADQEEKAQKKAVTNPRDLDFIARYKRGETLQQIGSVHGITRERVRQRLAKYSILRNEGGAAVRADHNALLNSLQKEKDRSEKIDRSFMRLLGAPRSIIEDLTGIKIRGPWQKNTPTCAYLTQKRSARYRGIGWEFDFPSWWRIWQESGKWNERGRGPGYCMSRFGDSGPYHPENVYICTIGQNFSDSYLVHSAAERTAKRKARKANPCA